MYSYEELKKQKANGKEFLWENITEEELRHLALDLDLIDAEIATLYDTEKEKVSYKRKKFGINKMKHSYNRFYKELFSDANIDLFSKAITEYAFRSGPIEDMHVAGQLKQADMLALNKYMVNRLAGLMKVMANSEWEKVSSVLWQYSRLASGWDVPEPDTTDFDNIKIGK
jgi:hypothetical protein